METVVIHGGRWLFGLCLFMSWLNAALHIVNAESMPYTRGMSFRALFDGKRGLLLAGTVAYLVLVGFWTAGIQPAWTGLAIVCAIGLIQALEAAQWPGDTVVRLGKYSPSGSALAGYVVAYFIAQHMGLAPDEAGWEAACGVMGAAWFLAGLKKWVRSGSRWFWGQTTGLMLLERAYMGPKVIRSLRIGLVSSPFTLKFIGVIGLAVELAGIAMCVPDLRWAFTAMVVVLLGLTAVVLGYTEPEWMLVLIALSWA